MLPTYGANHGCSRLAANGVGKRIFHLELLKASSSQMKKTTLKQWQESGHGKTTPLETVIALMANIDPLNGIPLGAHVRQFTSLAQEEHVLLWCEGIIRSSCTRRPLRFFSRTTRKPPPCTRRRVFLLKKTMFFMYESSLLFIYRKMLLLHKTRTSCSVSEEYVLLATEKILF